MDLEQRSLLSLAQHSDQMSTNAAFDSPEVSLFGHISLLPRRQTTAVLKPPIQLPCRKPRAKRFFFRPSYPGKIVLQDREPPLLRTPSLFIRNLLDEKYRYDSIHTPAVPKLVRIKHRHTHSLGNLPGTYAIK